MKTIKLYGPPGCGKTHTLMDIMEQELKNGVAPARIALVTFTKKGADEAKHRAITKFDLTEEDLPYFRTLHSLAFKSMGASIGEVMQGKHWNEFFNLIGMRYSGGDIATNGIPGKEQVGDLCILLNGMCRNRLQDPSDTYYDLNLPLSWNDYLMFQRVLAKFKETNGLIDFTDMLEGFSYELPIDVAIIDEAQDLSPLQWKVVDTAFSSVDRMYLAGDDDQAIYKWAGADAGLFRERPGEARVLNQSYRLPRSIWALANNIAAHIHERKEKIWKPRDEEGNVRHVKTVDEIDVESGEWLLLARNKRALSKYTKRVRELGFPYLREGKTSIDEKHFEAIQSWVRLNKGDSIDKWGVKRMLDFIPGSSTDSVLFEKAVDSHLFDMPTIRTNMILPVDGEWYDVLQGISHSDRNYYRQVLAHGESLKNTPRIKISTIHAAKGGEADNVVLLGDMSKRCFDEYKQYPDEMNRVFYVGVTRAKQTLYIIAGTTNKKYKFPWDKIG